MCTKKNLVTNAWKILEEKKVHGWKFGETSDVYEQYLRSQENKEKRDMVVKPDGKRYIWANRLQVASMEKY